MESGRKWVCARKGPSLPAALVLGAPWHYPGARSQGRDRKLSSAAVL